MEKQEIIFSQLLLLLLPSSFFFGTSQFLKRMEPAFNCGFYSVTLVRSAVTVKKVSRVFTTHNTSRVYEGFLNFLKHGMGGGVPEKYEFYQVRVWKSKTFSPLAPHPAST